MGIPEGRGILRRGGLGGGRTMGCEEYCQDPCQARRAIAHLPWNAGEIHTPRVRFPPAPLGQEPALGWEWRTGAVFSSPTIAHVPSSFVRTRISQLKAGSFLRVPSLHLL